MAGYGFGWPSRCMIQLGVLLSVVVLLIPITWGEMYDLSLPSKLPPKSCTRGCARWRALQADGSPQPQEAADRMWKQSPPEGNHCAMPGRAVQCCNMYNASLAGLWPNCCPVWEMVTAPAPYGSLGAVCLNTPTWQLDSALATAHRLAPRQHVSPELDEEYIDKAALASPSSMLGDSPLCYPGTPAHTMSGPGFNGAFCWCKDPPKQGPSWGLCTSPPAAVEQLNLQLAGPTDIVVSFATFEDPGAVRAPPRVEYHESGQAVQSAQGVTHIYSMNATGHSMITNKTYFLHFVRLSKLRERTTYNYRARSGGSEWTRWNNFTSLYSTGETRLAMFGDMGVYSWNAMGGLLNDSRVAIDAVVHIGDHAYNYGDANGTRADSYLDGYSPILSTLPWVPVVGNHEGYDSFYFFFNETDGENSKVDPIASTSDSSTPARTKRVGAMSAQPMPHPMTTILRTGVGQFGAGARSDLQGQLFAGGSGTPRWFSLQIGMVHLVALDCMVNWAPPSAAQNQTDPDAIAMLEWLTAELVAVDRERTPWLVVVAHYPVFCSGCLTGTPAGMPAALEPLFLDHGVDIYVAGHWHYYESLWPTVSASHHRYGIPNTSATPPLPTRRSFVDPDATIYVTAGNGGSPGPDGGAGSMLGARFGSEQYGYGRLVAHNATHLTWTQVANTETGGVLDRWTVVQHRHGRFNPGPVMPPAPIPHPTPPPPPIGPPPPARLRIVTLDVCRHYWNWACNASSIPGGPNGGGQGPCCMANSSNGWFSWRDQGSGSPADLQLYTARPASADPYYFAHTLPSKLRPPKAMADYRLGDYAESSYFGPRQGHDGVWDGVITSSDGLGLWRPGSGAPLALIDRPKDDSSNTDDALTAESRWLAQPIGFELLLSGGWPSDPLPSVSPIAVWKPIAPKGFTAVGAVISPGASQPPRRSAVRVVANECVATCPATQLWCNAVSPNGRCAPANGKSGGWNIAVYVANTAKADSLRSNISSVATRPMNLLWMTVNQTDIQTTVPCVLADCLLERRHSGPTTQNAQ